MFPNAIVYAGKADASVLAQRGRDEQGADEKQKFFHDAAVVYDPYVQAGKFKPILGDTQLAPGITAVDAHGHTPGPHDLCSGIEGPEAYVVGDPGTRGCRPIIPSRR